MGKKQLFIIVILGIVLSVFSLSAINEKSSLTENVSVFPSELPSKFEKSVQPERLASFEDDKADDCEEYCYIDFSADPKPILLVPETSDDAYAESLKYQLIDGMKNASTDGLLDGCTFIRAPKASDIRIVKMPMVSTPDLDGYKIISGPTGSGVDDVQITDSYAILKKLGALMNTNLAKENADGSKNLVVSAAKIEIKDKAGNISTGTTISQPYQKKLMFYLNIPTRDYDQANLSEDTIAHETAHMLTYQSQEIEKGALNALRSPFDQHSVDSSGATLSQNNILAPKKDDHQKTTLTKKQIEDFKIVCEKNPNKVKNLDKEDLVAACGDDVCDPNRENSTTCPEDCLEGDRAKCQWKSGKEDAKVCGGACPDPRVTCGTKGSPSGKDCGCYYYCGDGIVHGNEECEQASDCPARAGMTASCTGCKCVYKGLP